MRVRRIATRLLTALAAMTMILGLMILLGCGSGPSEAQLLRDRATAAESLVHLVLIGMLLVGLIAFIGGIILGARSRREAQDRPQ